MYKKFKKTIIVLLIVILIAFLYYYIFDETKITAHATRVIDGDTFVIDSGEKIRLIGMNTPERNEYYYIEAKERLEALILNKTIYLEKDKKNKDKYGRLLRYAYTDDSFVNFELVKEGYARSYLIEPNDRYINKIKETEIEAKNKKIGIWNFSNTSH
ncbi:thermonuclease family protein [Candidatus Woesearchaeota archaeon]|nr:thermonuclease family protein [Candidatus Woesearchaeota archaeon]